MKDEQRDLRVNEQAKVISATTGSIERYSASTEKREIEGCFFDFKDIGFPPRVKKNPLIEPRLSGQVSQSSSQKESNLKEGEYDGINQALDPEEHRE